MRYDERVTAIILKQQAMNEADVLLTLYTEEYGKLRALATAVRRPSSKLSYALQPGSLFEARLVGRTMHDLLKLAGATPKHIYIRELSEIRGVLLFWIQEVVLRATPDAETNSTLFKIALEYMQAVGIFSEIYEHSKPLIIATSAQILQALGSAVHEPAEEPKFYSVFGGGFFLEPNSADATAITHDLWERYSKLVRTPLLEAVSLQTQPEDALLLSVLSRSLEQYIDRTIRTGAFFGGILNSEA